MIKHRFANHFCVQINQNLIKNQYIYQMFTFLSSHAQHLTLVKNTKKWGLAIDSLSFHVQIQISEKNIFRYLPLFVIFIIFFVRIYIYLSKNQNNKCNRKKIERKLSEGKSFKETKRLWSRINNFLSGVNNPVGPSSKFTKNASSFMSKITLLSALRLVSNVIGSTYSCIAVTGLVEFDWSPFE